MNNFIYKNPTKILFGKGQIEKLSEEVPLSANVLMIYGGGSIKKNGVYNQVKKALEGRSVKEFSGISANPEYEVLLEAVEVVQKEKIDFILAVGGGSVIDGTKFISAAAKYEGESAWDIIKKSHEIKDVVPFGTVLTLPATGSEMNSGSVISRRSTQEKLSFSSPLLFPQFSVLDPQVVASLPKQQIANGIVDAFMHTMEQYMTYPVGGLLQDRLSESILQTLIEVGPKVLGDPTDYESAANFMWSCTMALNYLIAQGVPTDWGVHVIGHELTALCGIDHGRSLAIIAPRYYEHLLLAKREKLVQFASRIWGIHCGTANELALGAIAKMEEFFQSLGVATRLSQYTKEYDGIAEKIQERFIERGWLGLGERKNVSPQDVKNIVRASY